MIGDDGFFFFGYLNPSSLIFSCFQEKSLRLQLTASQQSYFSDFDFKTPLDTSSTFKKY